MTRIDISLRMCFWTKLQIILERWRFEQKTFFFFNFLTGHGAAVNWYYVRSATCIDVPSLTLLSQALSSTSSWQCTLVPSCKHPSRNFNLYHVLDSPPLTSTLSQVHSGTSLKSTNFNSLWRFWQSRFLFDVLVACFRCWLPHVGACWSPYLLTSASSLISKPIIV